MKISTALPFAIGLGTGYVLGAAAGRARFTQIKDAATNLAHHPNVQEVVFDLADRARANSHRLPGPADRLVSRAATKLEDEMTQPASDTA